MKKVSIKGFPIYNGVVNDGAIIEIPIPADLVELALDKSQDEGAKWDLMCSKLPEYGFMNPIGKMSIEKISIDGEWKDFH
tara:strand:- start:1058 stop:1297 length:240 start_codon:yes stop_codon:yes gene_type:complete